MIQRIQSIFLVLAGLFPAFTLLVPLVNFSNSAQAFTMYGVGFSSAQPVEFESSHAGLLVFAFCSLAISFVSIFGYKNRKRQIALVKRGICANVLWYVSFAVYVWYIASRANTSFSLEFGCLFPFFSILMQVLAKRYIKRDEDLVKAADRIR